MHQCFHRWDSNQDHGKGKKVSVWCIPNTSPACSAPEFSTNHQESGVDGTLRWELPLPSLTSDSEADFGNPEAALGIFALDMTDTET
jgi:hypothetical protein